MRKKFSLENAQFSDSSDEDLKFPCGELLQLYNKQYNFVLQETNKFYTHCKQSIQKFISLNQFGVGFNIPFLYTSLLKIEENTIGFSDHQKQLLQQKKDLRKRYEGSFHTILQRMGKVIEDLLDFQINFKRDYLGQNMKKPQNIKARIKRMKNVAYQESLNISPASSVKQTYTQGAQIVENQQKQIRSILQKKMCPQQVKLTKVCNKNQPALSNVNKLLEKVQDMKKNVKESRIREEKILQIFNKKKFSNFESSETSFTEEPENRRKQSTDSYLEYKKITNNPVFQKMRKKNLDFENYTNNKQVYN